MYQSENIADLATALCKLQSQLEGAKKDSTNPFFKSKYADLESVWEAVRSLLEPNGLSVTQTMGTYSGPDTEVPSTTLITTLMHSSGQWIRGEMPLYLKVQDPQGQGSAITYARRYCLAAILGIHQTDDDAESATIRTTQYGKTQAPQNYPQTSSTKSDSPAQGETWVGKSPAISDEQAAKAASAQQDDRGAGDSVEGHGQEAGSKETADSAGKVAAIKGGLLGVLEYAKKRGHTEEEVEEFIKTRFNATQRSTLKFTSSDLSVILTKFSTPKK